MAQLAAAEMHHGTDSDLPSLGTVSSAVLGESESASESLPSYDDVDVHLGGSMVKSAWSCACQCLSDPDIRSRAESLRTKLRAMSREARKLHVWTELKKIYVERAPRQRQTYLLCGLKVCRRSWCRTMAIGSSALRAFQKSIADGMLAPLQDGRQGQRLPRCPDDKSKDVDQFLYWRWSDIAEHLPAEPDSGESSDDDDYGAGGCAPATLTVALGADEVAHVSGPRRRMVHMALAEWYDMYKGRSKCDKPASRRTFVRVYKQRWKSFLKVAAHVTMGKCMTCEELKEMRRKAVLPEQKAQATLGQTKHVEAVLKDRRLDGIIQGIALGSCKAGPKVWSKTILNWDQDWMDQAKFRCPRNTSMNKQLADMWRPQLGAGRGYHGW